MFVLYKNMSARFLILSILIEFNELFPELILILEIFELFSLDCDSLSNIFILLTLLNESSLDGI